MNIRFTSGAFALTILGLCCTGCSSGSSGGQSFNSFAQNLVADTADDTEPVEINGRDFRFSENEDAFDNLFP